MSNSEVGTFTVLTIAALFSWVLGAIEKTDCLLCIISMTLIYILQVLCRIKSNIEKT